MINFELIFVTGMRLVTTALSVLFVKSRGSSIVCLSKGPFLLSYPGLLLGGNLYIVSLCGPVEDRGEPGGGVRSLFPPCGCLSHLAVGKHLYPPSHLTSSVFVWVLCHRVIVETRFYSTEVSQ